MGIEFKVIYSGVILFIYIQVTVSTTIHIPHIKQQADSVGIVQNGRSSFIGSVETVARLRLRIGEARLEGMIGRRRHGI